MTLDFLPSLDHGLHIALDVLSVIGGASILAPALPHPQQDGAGKFFALIKQISKIINAIAFNVEKFQKIKEVLEEKPEQTEEVTE